MKRNALILFSDPTYEISEREWEPQYFKERFGDEVNLHIALYNEIFFYLGSDGIQKLYVKNKEISLDESLAFVWFRTRGERSDFMFEMLPFMTGLAYLLKKKNIKFFDEELGDMLSLNKFSDKIILSYEKVLIPKTFLVTSTDSIDRQFVIDTIGFPMVLKDKAYGSRGDGVSLVNNIEELNAFLKVNHNFIMMQEFIPNDLEYRFVTSNYKVGRIEQRWHKAEEKFRNNSCLGAKEKVIALDAVEPFIIEETERVARIFKRNLCGFDLIKHEGKYYFIEANHTPGFDNPNSVDKSYYYDLEIYSVNVVIDDIKKNIE